MNEQINNEPLSLIERVLILEKTLKGILEQLSNPIVETQCYDLTQASVFLGISKSTLYRIMRSREINFITVSGHRKFTKTDLEKYIEKNSRKSFNSAY